MSAKGEEHEERADSRGPRRFEDQNIFSPNTLRKPTSDTIEYLSQRVVGSRPGTLTNKVSSTPGCPAGRREREPPEYSALDTTSFVPKPWSIHAWKVIQDAVLTNHMRSRFLAIAFTSSPLKLSTISKPSTPNASTQH